MNYSETVDVLTDFFEVALHQILYIREVYPSELFEKRKKYNIPVQMCRHPLLNKYIRDVVAACKPEILQGNVERMCILITTVQMVPLERFVFELQAHLPESGHQAQDKGKGAMLPENIVSTLSPTDLEHCLRSFLIKLNTCDAFLLPNPKEEMTFTVVIERREEGEPSQPSDIRPWVPAIVSEQSGGISKASIIPLRTMDTGIFKMQLLVEENEVKSKFVSTPSS
ncbi:hypothetical protein BZG36_02379 [Bifiguratus adelaidae]|uniref:HORMA domain-containing protein n=1 Tax=Bifiguratus adelaidae TaxID=1938954 RepID=A0A261Y178_9FUNG|nr:hypothetical protein BZG36_02379 [Bifiguratus adelaidae]